MNAFLMMGTQNDILPTLLQKIYTLNVIPKEGPFLVLQEIIDHKQDNSALTIDNGYIQTANGNKVPTKQTTRGWKLLCQRRDGTSSWVPLVELKDSNPVESAEYAIAANKIHEEAAFKWWVPAVIRQCHQIIAKLKWQYWRVTHNLECNYQKWLRKHYVSMLRQVQLFGQMQSVRKWQK